MMPGRLAESPAKSRRPNVGAVRMLRIGLAGIRTIVQALILERGGIIGQAATRSGGPDPRI